MKSLAIVCGILSATMVVGCEDNHSSAKPPAQNGASAGGTIYAGKTKSEDGKIKDSSRRSDDPCEKYLKGRSCVTNYSDEEMKVYRAIVESYLRKCRDSGISPDTFSSAINSALESVAASLTMLKGMPNEKELIIQARSQLPE